MPGYFLVTKLTLWKNPLFAAIGSIGLSFLLSPLITLPGSILFHRATPYVITLSIDLFLLVLLYSLRDREPIRFPEKNHSLFLGPLFLLICSLVFIYSDITKLGPYSEDWAYLFGIIKELSRNMPPSNPEASFLLLKQSWGFWFLFALVHSLGGVSVWKVLEFMPVLLSFVYLGLVYMILFQATKNSSMGLWAIALLALGKQSDWVLRGFQGLGWHPGYFFNLHWEEAQALTGYSLLWGWYILPSIIPPLTSLFFLIRYQQERRKKDLWFSLGACSISPFFHPVFYFSFLAGFSLMVLFQWMRKKYGSWLLLYALTFLPYFLTFYLYVKPGTPDIPIYQWYTDSASILIAIREYVKVNGVVLPFALLAFCFSPEARTWFLPFSFLFAFLNLFGQGVVNHTAHFLYQNSLYITLPSAIGLGMLKKIPRWSRILFILLVFSIIIPPFYFQVLHRLETGWEGAVDVEQNAAGEYIRSYTDGNSTFVILPDSRYSLVCVEGIGERKVISGHFNHLNKYETMNFIRNLNEEIKHFYSSSDLQEKHIFLQKYQAYYIFLGPEEITFMKEQKTDIERLKKVDQLVYRSKNVEILKVKLGDQS